MQKDFDTLKKELLTAAKAKRACADEYSRACHATTEAELLKVILDNIKWCKENKVISDEFFKGFTPEIFYASGIANTGSDNTGYSNTGDRNTGDRNTGDRNTGDRNTGDRNTGDRNTGDRNTGDRNTGDRNTGDRNTGDRNTGDRNTGDRNTGYRNTGYSNTGDWNTGDRNTGYSNTGDSNIGFFCTSDKNPCIPMFNKPSAWTIEDVHNSRAFYIMRRDVDTKQWISESMMTDAEKENFPSYKTAGGYLKDIPFKEAFTNAWYNWDEENRSLFTTLPNFDAAIFEEITGVNVNDKRTES